MQPLTEDQIKEAFDRKDIKVFTKASDFHKYIYNENLNNTALLLMSSGNYGGLDFDKIV